MQENKNKYYDIAERIYDLDGEVYECVGSSLGRTFTGDKRTCVNNLVMLMRTKPQGHLLRSELALISNMARTIRKDEDRSRLMKKYDEILKEIAELLQVSVRLKFWMKTGEVEYSESASEVFKRRSSYYLYRKNAGKCRK